jgi:hypothetical protein
MILLALAAVALSGAGLVAAAFPGRAASGADRALRAALALLFGLGCWSAAGAASLLLSGRSGPEKDLALCLAGAALLLAARRKPAGEPGQRQPAPAWLWASFAAAALACTAFFVEHTLRFPDGGWDAWMIWNLRARFLVRAADFRTAFSPDLLVWAHQDYPWLLPGLVAQVFRLIGSESPLVPALLAWIFGALAAALVALTLARLRGAMWGLLGGLALLTTPCFATFASNQQSDVPLGAFLAAAAGLLALAIEDPRRPAGLFALAGFAAGLGTWTKNEGALYAALLAAALLLRLRDLRSATWFMLGAAPAGALLLFFKLGLAPPNDLAAFSTPGGLLSRALDPLRWGHLALYTLRRIFYFQDFALWVIAEILVLLLVVRRLPPRPSHAVLGTALLLSFFAYAPIYVLQPHPLDWLYRTSVDRLFIQLWPAAILATLMALATATAPAPATART